MKKKSVNNILNKAQKYHTLEKDEVLQLIESSGNELYNAANEVRKECTGDGVYIRALIEFSNYCTRTCYYCGLRAANKKIHRYRMDFNEIIASANNAFQKGFRTVVLQSGEDAGFSLEELCRIIKEIKNNDMAVTLSIGEKTYEEYKELKNAGADRYLLRIETTNRELYQKYHPNMSFENRLRCLENLRTLGYEVGTGSLIGLDGQTIEMIADDILFFKNINADMIGIGVFIPHPDTPLGITDAGDFDLALKAVAITRLLLPDINIPATTAMETLMPNGRSLVLSAGANVVMLNAAENNEHKKDYSIYPDKAGVNESLDLSLTKLKKILVPIERNILISKGFRVDNKTV